MWRFVISLPVALALFAFEGSRHAVAESPNYKNAPVLEHTSIGRLGILIPEGWSAKAGGGGAYVIANSSSGHGEPLSLAVFTTQAGLVAPTYPSLEQTALSMLEGGAILLGGGSRETPAGRWSNFASESDRQRLTIYVRSDKATNLDVVAMVSGPTGVFQSSDAEKMIVAVGESVIDNPSKFRPPARAKITEQPNSEVDRYVLVGSGSTSVGITGSRQAGSLEGTMVERADILGSWFVTALQGRASTEFSSGNLIDMFGSGIEYEFGPSGSYQMTWTFAVTTGLLMTNAEVLETGRWKLSESVLELVPSKHDGQMTIMSGETHSVFERRSGRRNYKAQRVGDQLVISGPCAPFQVELECDDQEGGTRQLDFPLSPSSAD